jgi:uncharacterized protein YbbK (DUF523 family)
MHLPSKVEIESLAAFTPDQPMRILVSACLSGEKCGFDGSSYGEHPWIRKLIALPNVQTFRFCPEHYSFGTPRDLPDIHGGNGFDVLEGKARVLSDKGADMTVGMIVAAKEMLKLAIESKVDVAVLMDMSAACGSQVLSDGYRLVENRKYQKGPGVCAALLIRNGLKVISQRDFRTLELLTRKLDSSHQIDPKAVDHHETAWYLDYFDGR